MRSPRSKWHALPCTVAMCLKGSSSSPSAMCHSTLRQFSMREMKWRTYLQSRRWNISSTNGVPARRACLDPLPQRNASRRSSPTTNPKQSKHSLFSASQPDIWDFREGGSRWEYLPVGTIVWVVIEYGNFSSANNNSSAVHWHFQYQAFVIIPHQ